MSFIIEPPFLNPGGSNWSNLFVLRESTAAFNQLCETFPDENCVLTSREFLVEVRGFIDALPNTPSSKPKPMTGTRQTTELSAENRNSALLH